MYACNDPTGNCDGFEGSLDEVARHIWLDHIGATRFAWPRRPEKRPAWLRRHGRVYWSGWRALPKFRRQALLAAWPFRGTVLDGLHRDVTHFAIRRGWVQYLGWSRGYKPTPPHVWWRPRGLFPSEVRAWPRPRAMCVDERYPLWRGDTLRSVMGPYTFTKTEVWGEAAKPDVVRVLLVPCEEHGVWVLHLRPGMRYEVVTDYDGLDHERVPRVIFPPNLEVTHIQLWKITERNEFGGPVGAKRTSNWKKYG